MTQTQPQRLVGDVRKTFGTNGELIVKLREDIPTAILKNKEPVFIYIGGLSVPFYMKSAESKGTAKLLVVFEDMETEALATELVGKSIYIPSKEPVVEPKGEFDVLVGFTAIDDSHGELGVVTEVMEIPGNPCLVLDNNGLEVIVPLNQDLISKVDPKKKEIHLTLPDGLLDLYQ